MAVHLLLEFRVGLGLRIGQLEVEDERHQCLSDEAPAIKAEMTALVGPSAVGVPGSLGDRAHDALARRCGMAALAASMKLLTSLASFSPGGALDARGNVDQGKRRSA